VHGGIPFINSLVPALPGSPCQQHDPGAPTRTSALGAPGQRLVTVADQNGPPLSEIGGGESVVLPAPVRIRLSRDLQNSHAHGVEG
jgi:hypothetical protein